VLVIVLCYCLYAVLLLLCCTVIVLLLLFVLSYVLIVCTVPLPPGVNPIAVDKYIYLSKFLCHTHTDGKDKLLEWPDRLCLLLYVSARIH